MHKEEGVVVITIAELHSSKPEIGFCRGSSPAGSVWEIRDGEDLWQRSRLSELSFVGQPYHENNSSFTIFNKRDNQHQTDHEQAKAGYTRNASRNSQYENNLNN